MKPRPRRVAAVLMLATAVFIAGSGGRAAASQQTIPLTLSLDDLVALNATVTVQQPTIQDGS